MCFPNLTLIAALTEQRLQHRVALEGDGHNWIFALQSAAKIRKVSLQ
jgi:hypothetical protein